MRRSAQYNVWRVLTPPPQDVPLAVCEARSVAAEDFISADAIFDKDGAIAFSFEALLLRYNPKQRWAHFSNMRTDEALMFKTHDTDPECGALRAAWRIRQSGLPGRRATARQHRDARHRLLVRISPFEPLTWRP